MSVSATGALLLTALAGCGWMVTEPPEAVLEGTWELTNNVLDSGVTSLLLTFDKDGQMTEINYVYNNLTITIDSGSFVRSSTDVKGSNVSISASWGSGSTFFFEGTLNAAQTVVDGSTSYELEITPAITISRPTGPATLTRQ